MESPGRFVFLVIAFIIYQIYTNYRKEQDKAKKRLEELKRKQAQGNPYVETTAQPTPVRQKPAPAIPPKVAQPQHPSYEQLPDEVVHMKQQKQERLAKQNQDRIKEKQSKLVLKVTDLQENRHFDLKQAIIQQAILERPYRED